MINSLLIVKQTCKWTYKLFLENVTFACFEHFILMFYNLPIFHTLWSNWKTSHLKHGNASENIHFISFLCFIHFFLQFFARETLFCTHIYLLWYFILIFFCRQKISFNLCFCKCRVNYALAKMEFQQIQRIIWKRFNEHKVRQNKGK